MYRSLALAFLAFTSMAAAPAQSVPLSADVKKDLGL